MREFRVGDRVEIIGRPRLDLIHHAHESDRGQSIFAKVIGKANIDGAWYALPDETRYRDRIGWGEHWVVPTEHLRRIGDARDDESTDDASSETKRRFNVGDRVEIVGTPRESLLSMAGVESHIFGEITEVDGDKATVRPDDEAFQNDVDEDRAWFVRFDDLRPASSETSESTPAAKPRRSSSQSKKATTDAQPLDPKRINVVQVDISKAIVGDDFPARPSQAFKDVMCELLIGEYERYGKSETDASS
jgi:hypothetical protein